MCLGSVCCCCRCCRCCCPVGPLPRWCPVHLFARFSCFSCFLLPCAFGWQPSLRYHALSEPQPWLRASSSQPPYQPYGWSFGYERYSDAAARCKTHDTANGDSTQPSQALELLDPLQSSTRMPRVPDKDAMVDSSRARLSSTKSDRERQLLHRVIWRRRRILHGRLPAAKLLAAGENEKRSLVEEGWSAHFHWQRVIANGSRRLPFVSSTLAALSFSEVQERAIHSATKQRMDRQRACGPCAMSSGNGYFRDRLGQVFGRAEEGCCWLSPLSHVKSVQLIFSYLSFHDSWFRVMASLILTKPHPKSLHEFRPVGCLTTFRKLLGSSEITAHHLEDASNGFPPTQTRWRSSVYFRARHVTVGWMVSAKVRSPSRLEKTVDRISQSQVGSMFSCKKCPSAACCRRKTMSLGGTCRPC